MLRIGILGCGNIAGTLAGTMVRMPDVLRIEACASRDKSKAEEFASRFDIPKAYGSYEELYEDPDVDLVYIATPHSHHKMQMLDALSHGKNVLSEKAFTVNEREAMEVFALAREKKLFAGEAIWTRYMPFRKTLRDIVDSGAIGRPMMLSAHLGYPVADKERLVRPELGGGALLDLGVYAINFALMMFGNDIADITSSCTKSDTGVDLQNSIIFRYADGRIADLQSTALCASDRQGIVCGDRGYIVCDNINNMLKADLYDAGHALVGTYNAPAQITGFEYQVRACIDAIREGRNETQYMPHNETLRPRTFSPVNLTMSAEIPSWPCPQRPFRQSWQNSRCCLHKGWRGMNLSAARHDHSHRWR